MKFYVKIFICRDMDLVVGYNNESLSMYNDGLRIMLKWLWLRILFIIGEWVYGFKLIVVM